MKNEIWKPITGFENLYEVSNFGNVKSLSKQRSLTQPNMITKEKLLKPSISKQGYSRVILTKDSKHFGMLVHRLVGKEFIENVNNYKYINHIDCNKQNNCSENLEWCTAKQNTLHAMENDLMDWSKAKKGENHGRSKLTKNDVTEIKSMLNVFSDIQISKKYNVSSATIYLIRQGAIWKSC